MNLVSRIRGNTYILAFLVILSTKIPGNSRKCQPPIFVKTKNFGENFPGKIWILGREFRETRIFLHFGVFWRPKFPGIREKVDPRFSWKLEILTKISREKSAFWLENSGKRVYSCIFTPVTDTNSREFSSRGRHFRGVLSKIVNFEKFGIFRKSQFFLEATFSWNITTPISLWVFL